MIRTDSGTEWTSALLAAQSRHKTLFDEALWDMVFSREQLLNSVWGDEFYGETRTVDVHVAALRKKLRWNDAIQTVHRVGYRLKRAGAKL